VDLAAHPQDRPGEVQKQGRGKPAPDACLCRRSSTPTTPRPSFSA
jgi:hypothetical protein